MHLRPALRRIFKACAFAIALSTSSSSLAQQPVPGWLAAHVGQAGGQIAKPILDRARALYFGKVDEGKIRNSCYFAMDATRPNSSGAEGSGRFYVICEAAQSFRVIAAGHGSGRNLKGVANFSNGRRCAKNFGNALDSNLTAGGAYLTSEIKTSFKGYYRNSPKQDAIFMRSFIQFDGQGETANARQRAIGGHAAALVSGICLRKRPNSPYADQDGYVPFGKLVDYSSGRSDGCTSWSPQDAQQIISMVQDNPTTLYIYPESADIARATSAGSLLTSPTSYWNASCLKEIGSPKFWPRSTLELILAQYKKAHPAPKPKPIPICEGP